MKPSDGGSQPGRRQPGHRTLGDRAGAIEDGLNGLPPVTSSPGGRAGPQRYDTGRKLEARRKDAVSGNGQRRWPPPLWVLAAAVASRCARATVVWCRVRQRTSSCHEAVRRHESLTGVLDVFRYESASVAASAWLRFGSWPARKGWGVARAKKPQPGVASCVGAQTTAAARTADTHGTRAGRGAAMVSAWNRGVCDGATPRRSRRSRPRAWAAPGWAARYAGRRRSIRHDGESVGGEVALRLPSPGAGRTQPRHDRSVRGSNADGTRSCAAPRREAMRARSAVSMGRAGDWVHSGREPANSYWHEGSPLADSDALARMRRGTGRSPDGEAAAAPSKWNQFSLGGESL
jgi:hypothetical protein